MNFFTPFTMPTGASIPEREVNIRDFGAQPGGEVLNTEAIAAAIEAVAQEGGGRVIFPAGCWLTGPIHLKSGVELHLEKDCEVRFSQKKELYLPPVYTLYEGVRCYTYSAMLYAYQCHDIAVTGEGTFNGQGHAWWYMSCVRTGVKDLYDAGEKHRPVETRVYQREEDGIRPGLLHFLDCKNVRIEGVTFTFSPFWTVHPTWCENIIVRNVTVRNPYMYAPNTDGVNLEGCRRGLVDGVFADTGDDAVCIKSGRDEDGRTVARPCEDIVVRNCRANRSHGGITVVEKGQVKGDVLLAIAGIMSDDSLVMVNSALEAAKDEAFRLGVSRGIDPFMTLSFMALPVIPSLRLTTRGVFDVLTQRYV